MGLVLSWREGCGGVVELVEAFDCVNEGSRLGTRRA